MNLFALAWLVATPHTYAVVIGNNQPPAGSALATLRYADDDAVAMAEFLDWMHAEVTLLTELDADSQKSHAGAAALAKTPTLATLEQTLRDIASKATPEDTLWFFFSGHGDVAEGKARLLLADTALDHDALFALLASVPARYTHLIIDACHAEELVQSRGAAVVSVDPEAAARALTAARPAALGIIVAASASQEAHEWSRYQRGVFTHELLSGLAGAADVNGDHVIEYSELHAFMTAANRQVQDRRAHLEVFAEPPRRFARVPLVNVAALGASFARLDVGGHVVVEDDRGARLLDANPEPGATLYLAVPAERTLFITGEHSEARFRLALGEERWIALEPASNEVASRGALASALAGGLFAAPFGPHYYSGFADRTDAAAVPLSAPGLSTQVLPAKTRVARGLMIGGGGLAVTSAVLGVLAGVAASDYSHTPWQRPALETQSRYEGLLICSLVAAGLAVAAGASGAVLYPWRGVPR